MTSMLGSWRLPPSMDTGRGPSGLMAATLWSVNRRFSHSDLSLSRSSSSFFVCSSCSCCSLSFCFSCLSSSVEACSSSWSVGKISTTCSCTVGSAAEEKASVMASSPTLYRTVSNVNLFVRISFVMFSMTFIIFFAFVDMSCTQRAMLKPTILPPQAASRGGEISMGADWPWPYTMTCASLSPDCRQWINCSQESRQPMPSRATFGSIRWFLSLHLNSATASGKTSSAPMVTSHSLMRS
mmetsp:Transcript_93695/g.260849  ORF Transcript_93695/g.260849 Transcript_93695/m.260849 type:complete len:239 (+) Transcript_93695:855-1571(+)